jgi:putative sigma-54 modulation protein
MNLSIKATNIELTPAIEGYVNERLNKIEKFIKEGESVNIYVEVGKTTNHHKQGDYFRAEINMEISGKKFYTFSEKEDLYNAIDNAKEEIIRQIISKKDRKQTLFKRGALRIKRIIKTISKD